MDSLYRIGMKLSPLFRAYSQLEVRGQKNIPASGEGGLLACNHSGSIWWDGICLASSIPERQIHFIAHHWDATIKPIKAILLQVGAHFLNPSLDNIDHEDPVVQGLKSGQLMCQYPEESYHSFWHRYTLFEFLPQFVKYAHLSSTPIIPMAVIGAEEATPVIFGPKFKGVPLHIPILFPVILPTKVIVEFGTPCTFEELTGISASETADKESYIQAAALVRDQVRNIISQYRTCRTKEIQYNQLSRWW